MVTLTAPGADRFGKTHSRRLSEDGKARRCSCRGYHNAEDPLLGTPIDPSTYDYEAAASFNANASRLFAVTIQKLSRILGRKLQVVRVVEFQTRGLVHVHALILGTVTQRSLALVVRGGINLRSGRKIAAATSNGWIWGNECKADVINATNPERAIGYLVKVVKYALKDTGNGACSHYDHGDKMARAAEKDLKCDNSIFQCKHGVRGKSGTSKVLMKPRGKPQCRKSRSHLLEVAQRAVVVVIDEPVKVGAFADTFSQSRATGVAPFEKHVSVARNGRTAINHSHLRISL